MVWGESDPARADTNLDMLRTEVLPKMEQLPGFCSMSLFVNRESGRSAMATTYDNREQMEQATDRAMEIRREATDQMGVRITDVADFDLVIHHLRVPELA